MRNPSGNRNRRRRRRDDEEPVLPDVTDDERNVGWGDDPESEGRDERWYREQRPPHHE